MSNKQTIDERWPSLRTVEPTEPELARAQVADPLAEDPLADDPLADAETDLSSESLENFEPPHANGDAQPHVDAAKATPSFVLSVNEAQDRLVEAQLRCQLAAAAQRDCRSRVALALEKFQRATMQTCTPEQLVRQHIASSNQERADRVAGKVPVRPQRRLGSAVDAFAYHTRNSGRNAGGGAAFRRGAHSQSGRNVLGVSRNAFPGSGWPQVKGER